ncbi:hypothetical protein GCM10017691_61510 [Pseudonocardia petroleophila]|uniref:Integral membrane protein n=1 Tax=Pseudonocardia petroleophila TaxID=37331 RepID=A0A7G7MM63_9PSEU|nr:hypothetical protein [Pseudonocardia petroleophila]QNG53874.1 hypothetical protein H6H00_08130 [Pseudonocardia petroleophila]
MTTSTASTAPTTSDAPLRLALRIDATASGALGVLALAATPLLVDLLGPPAPVLVGVGAFFVVFAAGLLVLAARRRIPRPAARTVVVGNAAWVVASVLVAVLAGQVLTGLGVAVVLVQAGAVAVFAELQRRGLRRMG